MSILEMQKPAGIGARPGYSSWLRRLDFSPQGLKMEWCQYYCYSFKKTMVRTGT